MTKIMVFFNPFCCDFLYEIFTLHLNLGTAIPSNRTPGEENTDA